VQQCYPRLWVSTFALLEKVKHVADDSPQRDYQALWVFLSAWLCEVAQCRAPSHPTDEIDAKETRILEAKGRADNSLCERLAAFNLQSS